MKSRPGRQSEKEKEGNLEPKPVHNTPCECTEEQLPQDFKGRQKTVVGSLSGRKKNRRRRKEYGGRGVVEGGDREKNTEEKKQCSTTAY